MRAGLIALMLGALCAPVWPAPAGEPFAAGVTAFREGRYAEALQFFLAARDAGESSRQLLHNLGVTFYRLGDYPRAGDAFRALLRYPDAAPLAHYNLGLVALQLERNEEARAEFGQAARTAAQPALRALAQQQLDKLLPAPAGRPLAASLIVDVASGFDDNVALVAETSSIPPAQRESWYSLLQAFGYVVLSGDRRRGWRLAGAAYRSAYPEAPRYSLTSIRLGPHYRARFGALHTDTGLAAIYLTLGGEHFETIGRASLRADYPLGESHTLTALYQFDYIDGGRDFEELGGWRQSLRLNDTWKLGPAELGFGYRLEKNRRRDFATSTQFASASPTRHRGFTDVHLRPSEAWRIDLGLEYEQSIFDEPDRFRRDGTDIVLRRFDQRSLGRITLSWTPTPDWQIATEYRQLLRQSNRASFEYLSNRYELRLEYRL